MKEQCSAKIIYDSWCHTRQCEKSAKVIRNGKPFCTVHDPEYIAKKRANKEVRWDREWEEKRRVRERQSLLAGIFQGIDNDTIRRNLKAYKSAVSSVVVHNK